MTGKPMQTAPTAQSPEATTTKQRRMTRDERRVQMSKGAHINSSAEWDFGMAKTISREEFQRRTSIGNRLILNAMDGIRDTAEVSHA